MTALNINIYILGSRRVSKGCIDIYIFHFQRAARVNPQQPSAATQRHQSWQHQLVSVLRSKGVVDTTVTADGEVKTVMSTKGEPGDDCGQSPATFPEDRLHPAKTAFYVLTKRKRVNNARDWNNGWLQKYF
eukprot:COSAG02_NODE_501_length_21049_cov_34.002768_6_plen_131_part_00